MATKLLIAIVLALGLAGSSCSWVLTVALYNNSAVDLAVYSEADTVQAYIAPGESAEVHVRGSQWIDFGMIAHLYNVPDFRSTGFIFEHKVKIQAENDGRLYLIPPDTAFPANIVAPQPDGFPLVPVKEVDLT